MYDLNITGWMNINELRQIEKWAKDVPLNGTIVEVGSYHGRSAIAWASSCDPTVIVHCIDNDICLEFLENTKHLTNLKSYQASSPNIENFDVNEIDIFFLDASHKNPNDMDNINFFLPRIKKGGLLCGHDYAPAEPEMAEDVIKNVRILEERLNQKVTLYAPDSELLAGPGPGRPNYSTLWSFRI
jgi:predicted O-methyltransferase YrrM